MARRRASMREGPLAELFKATEAAQRQAERAEREGQANADGAEAPTVEHAPSKPSVPTLAAAPAAAPTPAAAPVERRYEEPPVSRLAEPAPRLHRTPRPASAAYLAVSPV